MTASSVGGAWATVRRGIALSPELRHDVPLAVVAALVATAGRVITPIVIQQILDRGLLGGDVNLRFVFAMLVLAGAVTLLTAAATGVMHLRATTMSESALSALRIRTFQHIHDLSMLHQASEQRGALVSRVTSDIDQISHFMQWAGLQIIVNVAQAMVAVVVMLAYSVPLTITVLVFVPVIALTVRAFQTRIEAAFMVVREAVSDMLATLAETVVGSAVIRGYGAEREVQTRLSTAIEHHRASAVRAGSLSSAFSGISAVLSAASVAAVLIVGTVLAARGGPTIGTVVAFLFLVQLFIEPIDIVGEAINEAQTAVAGWRRVLDVLDLEPDVADPGGGVELSPEPLEILFDRVDFRYPRAGETPRTATGTLALTGVDVRIAPNSKVAVVGETGAGKTTFAKLLVRLMDPSDGQVQIGGIDIRRVEFASLRARTVMVPQEGGLFRGTIADNVAMGRP
ncbi:MAG: ABC transporter ATP-binding protein/permease, partial [Acidimicrobiia bacterium]|nr:ABC transporter ATP-binding protein/permease [Acidimicrobiia bacterium]